MVQAGRPSVVSREAGLRSVHVTPPTNLQKITVLHDSSQTCCNTSLQNSHSLHSTLTCTSIVVQTHKPVHAPTMWLVMQHKCEGSCAKCAQSTHHITAAALQQQCKCQQPCNG